MRRLAVTLATLSLLACAGTASGGGAFAQAFTEDAVVTTTWFQGNAREFALRSKEMADRGRHSKHPIQPI